MKLLKTLIATFIAFNVTSAWADLRKSATSYDVCSPIVHFKLPAGWTSAYLMIGGTGTPFPKADAEGWSTIDLGSIRTNDAPSFFINTTNSFACNNGYCVTKSSITKNLSNDPSANGFTCATFGKNDGADVWIQEHPDPHKAGQVYITVGNKPDVKTFYVFIPQGTDWKIAEPIIHEVYANGYANEQPLYIDENCGWYYRRYIDEEVPKSVYIRKDYDETMIDPIGIGTDPIPLGDLFDLFSSDVGYNGDLYFVADKEEASLLPYSGMDFYTSRPPVEGTCGFELTALIYDTDASLHGAFTCAPNWSQAIEGTERALYNACFYASANYPVNSSGEEVVPCVGVTQGMVESTLDPKTKKMKLTAKGKTCFGPQADEAFAAMFSATPNVNEGYCLGMPIYINENGKYEFNSAYYQSPGAPARGGFFPAEEPPNAIHMFTERLPAAENKRKAEGPTFFTTDRMNQTSKSPQGLRTIHPTEEIPVSDLICNGPGWAGGIDCNGLYAVGSEFKLDGKYPTEAASQISKIFNVTWCGDGWGWSCPSDEPEGWPMYEEGTETLVKTSSYGYSTGTHRWTSGKSDSDVLTKAGRNQQFCFESHAHFHYKKNLKLSVSGDDDIWIYIDNKLAIDIGGTHLPAPGYVVLDDFMGSYAKIGNSYDIDIYFCDRRTTMSNFSIKTNIFMEQTVGERVSSGLTLKNNTSSAEAAKGNAQYNMCYSPTDIVTCVDIAMGKGVGGCEQITPKNISYMLTTDITGKDNSQVEISEKEFAKTAVWFNGGIDISDREAPIINKEKLQNALGAGKFYLLAKYNSEVAVIEIDITTTIDVASRDAVALDKNGDPSISYKFQSQAMASIPKEDGSYDINQMIPLYIASVEDPCAVGQKNCKEPVVLKSIKGAQYSLATSNKKVLFFEKMSGKLVQFDPAKSRKTSNKGIDTIYVTIPLADMYTYEESASIAVNGGVYNANVSFFAPKLVFVESDTSTKAITGDKDTEIRLQNSTYDFHLLALNGSTDKPCGEKCNFTLALGSETSAGLTLLSGEELVNGRATIQVSSSKTFEKCEEKGCGTATLYIIGPNSTLTFATYENMQFQKPPVPMPQFADIFDVYGAKPKSEMNIASKYFSKDKEYLDGIGDSIIVYYHRNIHKDSLPEKIAVFWDFNTKDSVVFDKSTVKKGAVCGADAKLDDEYCLARISLSGKNLSKKMKTSGKGKVKSWTKTTVKNKAVTKVYECVAYDRIAPVITSAVSIRSKSSKTAQLKVTFSEKVQKTADGAEEGDNLFSFYVNNTSKAKYLASLPEPPEAASAQNLDSVHTFVYDTTTTFPQAGDYIRIRTLDGVGLITDQSDYKAEASFNKSRPKKDSTYNWNTATGYDATKRLPSPWVLIAEGSTKDLDEDEKIDDNKDDNKDDNNDDKNKDDNKDNDDNKNKDDDNNNDNGKDDDSGKDNGKDNDKDDDNGKNKKNEYAAPTFRVELKGPFEFAIVFEDNLPSLAKQYAVMDMKGQVLSVGELSSSDTRVKVPTSGSYVVKVGLGYKQVNVK